MNSDDEKNSNNNGLLGYFMDISSGVGVLKKVINTASDVVPTVHEMIKIFFIELKKSRVLVVGNTGTGKTALVENVIAGRKHAEAKFKSTKDIVEYMADRPGVPFLVADTPGNEAFFEVLEEALDKLPTKHFLGIVNVVSYGYNDSYSIRPEDDSPQAYLPDSDGEINSSYLESQREKDLVFLERWLMKRRGMHDKINSILTVVNKYDLWSVDEDEIAAYYGPEGEYGKRICEAIGEARYDFVMACGEPKLGTNFRGRVPKVSAVGADTVQQKNSECVAKIDFMVRRQS
ncbi:MAG: hypothetical protein HOE62_15990 [Alphaproteobacteria bacterium]|jgi:hypothetical protein|nr:hypothetical protein [Alphaproteobacteria bacterium]MBT4019454.1 hypothetical protein [Alphaproteobacteria bacterium]MBT4967276.1 hypothetical protein [Alphaproteobacteria bacterium]MBT5160481.1 hypothetical protein [Alphaproteobacteria bacterium]MBT5917435.1 hypothetical protein [Alphaproteobacteria bacterium]